MIKLRLSPETLLPLQGTLSNFARKKGLPVTQPLFLDAEGYSCKHKPAVKTHLLHTAAENETAR